MFIIDEWINNSSLYIQWNVIQLYKGIKYNMDESLEYYTKWKKNKKDHLLYESMYTKCPVD